MSPLAAIVWLVPALAVVPVLAVLGELADRTFQQHMDATLWKALPPWKS